MKKFTFKLTALLLFSIGLSSVTVTAQKMTAEEVLAKHLDSIGSPKVRALIKNQFALAELEVKVKGSATPMVGKAVILSENDKSLWGMNLNSNDYPQDRFGFDGKETKVGYTRPGVRSVIGGFIYSYKELLKEGLLGGSLLSSWALLNYDARKGKISYDGTKKIDDKETHTLSYSPKGGSDLTIKMYFDAKTFRHVRTEYTRVVSAIQGRTVDSSAAQSADYYRLTENFSDFQTSSGITIPKIYKISYSFTNNSPVRSSPNSNKEIDWVFSITNFSTNQELDQNSFNIDAK